MNNTFMCDLLAACKLQDTGQYGNVNEYGGNISPAAIPDSTNVGTHLENSANLNSGIRVRSNVERKPVTTPVNQAAI